MASLRAIRSRIKSVKGTQKITKAMKMVAAAKLRRAQDAVVRARPYAQLIDEMLAQLALAREDADLPPHPLMVVALPPPPEWGLRPPVAALGAGSIPTTTVAGR